jgi:hypothetical protein
MNCSASTILSNWRASSTAAFSSDGALTLVMPMVEPSSGGLTISGRPSSATTPSRSVSGVMVAYFGVGTPAASQTILVVILSMPTRRGHHAAAGVGNAQLLERALQAAVFAVAAVQRDEHAVEFFRGQFGQRALGRIEGVGVDALRFQRLQHAGAGHEGDLALGGTAAEQDADLAQRKFR